MRRLLPGREFCRIGAIDGSNGRWIPYVMPAVRTPGIRKAVAGRASGARVAVSKYVLESAPGGAGAGANLLILEKNGVRARDAPAERRYLAFATSLPRPSVAGLPGGYRKRRRVEAGRTAP